MTKTNIWLIVTAAFFAAVVLVLILLSNSWDHPGNASGNISGQWMHRNEPVNVAIDWRGPSHFVGAKSQIVHFTVQLKLDTAALSPKPYSSHAAILPNQIAPPKKESQTQPINNQVLVQTEAPKVPSDTFPKYIWLWFTGQNSTVKFLNDSPVNIVGFEKELSSSIKNSFDAVVTPKGSGTFGLSFNFGSVSKNQKFFDDWGVGGEWTLKSYPTFAIAALPYGISLIIFGIVLGLSLFLRWRFQLLRDKTERDLHILQDRAKDNAINTHLAWETAKIKLEEYLNRNLLQVNLVFWVAVLVMIVGFIFVLMGVILSIKNPAVFSLNPKNLSSSALATGSGIITQFIGAIFMVIYRSIMQQANEFMSVLERINAAGMAVSELERIPDSLTELKNGARARFAESLLYANHVIRAKIPLEPDK
jgi:hypothetical protein